jgi:hypothetical protein
MAATAARYAAVAQMAGEPFPEGAPAFEVVERLAGNGTTDFGAPAMPAAPDAEPLTKADAARLAALLEAAWQLLDDVVERAPAVLAKGPRGGGRDRDEVAAHLLGAEASYARMLGLRHKEPGWGDRPAVSALRADIVRALRGSYDPKVANNWKWLPRYAARRITWHVLDHAWEIEDKGGLEPRHA